MNIPEPLLEEARARSLAEGRTLGELVAEGLRILLNRDTGDGTDPVERLVTFGGRGLQDGVDLDDTAGLLERMESP